jgi:hypothetical protein
MITKKGCAFAQPAKGVPWRMKRATFSAPLLRRTPARNLAQAIRNRFEPLGGVELELPEREPVREPPRPSK